MGQLLMRTSGASFDEVAGLVDKLEEEGIAHYQTDSGFWRLGVDGLWVSDSADLERAKALLADYQAEYRQQIREEHRAQHARGEALGFMGQLWRQPLKVLLALVAVGAILALSLVPFMRGL